MAKNFNLKKATPYHFATDIAVSPATTYAGELALPYLAPAVKLAATVSNGYVTESNIFNFRRESSFYR